MKRLLVLAMLVACNDATQNAPTQLNLDRPVDIAFACYGGMRITGGGAGTSDQGITVSAQPLASCDFRSGPRATGDSAPAPPGQEAIPGGKPVPSVSWYSFVLQSGPGTVALGRFETKPSSSFGGGDVVMLDTDPLTPGKNGISVGENPVAIATDKAGCFEVIANEGSCDMSMLDINSVFSANPAGGIHPTVKRVPIKNGAGEVIRARPAAMVFEPPGGTIGVECPTQPSGLAYVAFPGCHLVAGVDVSTGTIVTGIGFDSSGVPMIVDPSTVSCPAECDGGAPTPGVRPVSLDLEQDPRSGRVVLAIGADNSNVLNVYDLDPTLFRPLSLTPIALQDTNGRLGVTSLAISPLIGMGGDTGTINDDLATGGDHQFVYAVTNDGTVRVADLTGLPRECDTEVDPRYIHDLQNVDQLSCFAVGDPTTPPRRPGARGPGIELYTDGVPTSVDIFRVEPIMGDTRAPGTPAKLIGTIAVISASDGRTFIVNIDNDDFADSVDQNDPLATPIPLDIAHQLRDAIPERGLKAEVDKKHVCDYAGPDPDSQNGNLGGPRAATAPTRTVPAGVIAQEKVGGLPLIRQVMCDGADEDLPVTELFFGAPDAVRDSVFPDLRALRSDENWTLTWEGSLSLDKADAAIDGPAVRFGQILVDAFGMHLVDDSHPYCDAGVERDDVVQLRGCDPSVGDAGCPAGYTCFVHPQSQVTGIGACILSTEAERLQNACKEYLTSLRRYTVGRTKSGELQLVARKHVLRTTPIDGCTDDAQCQMLANYALQNDSSSNPFEDKTPADPHTWSCQVDPDRAPVPGTGKRCILMCNADTADTDCTFGTVCHAGYCMEGVVPPQACVNSPQRYELRAGEAFTVIGSRQGYMHSTIADAAGNCIKDPNANPFMAGRMPLTAAPCDPTADPRTGKRIDGTYEPNPCQLTVPQAEYQLNYTPGTCTLATPNLVVATRDTIGIRLRTRTMQLTLVDPTYPGDLRCNGDRGGSLVNIPLVTPGLQLAFRQTAGFLPLTIGIQPSFPIKVVRGPTQSIWVIDEGDYLSTSITQPSTRGKVFRVESRALNVINLLE